MRYFGKQISYVYVTQIIRNRVRAFTYTSVRNEDAGDL